MRVLHGLEGLRQITCGAIISVGNFDGLHRGHLQILKLAQQLQESGDGGAIAIVTFEPHPLTVLRPAAVPPRLTPPEFKRALLEEQDVDELVILAPTPEVLNLEAEAFFHLLRDAAQVRHIIEGPSFNFGKNRGGSIEKLRQWTAGSPVKLHVIDAVTVPLLDMHVVAVNSSIVRWLLARGRVRDAAIALGRPYTLVGSVIHGEKRGRAIGMPTANLAVNEQLIPADAVYAARCAVDGRTYAVGLSIGTNPTFDGNARTVEAHLIGFDGDLYGHTIEVEILDWLRDQRRFSDVPSLLIQIQSDLTAAQVRLQWAASDPIVTDELALPGSPR